MSLTEGLTKLPTLAADGGSVEPLPLTVSAGSDPSAGLWRRIGRNLAAAYLAALVVIAVIAPWISPYSVNGTDVNNLLAGPSAQHLLGTDEVGRDVLSRLLLGTRSSLLGIALAVAVAVVVGGLWGLLAGYGPRAADEVLMRFADSILSFPALVLAVAVVGALGPSLVHAMTAVGIIFSPGMARLVRAEVLKVRQQDYVRYARQYGMGLVGTAARHVIPNIAAPIAVQAVILSGIALIAEAGLSFLGLGPQPPSPNWGASLGSAFQYINQAPGLMLGPGLAIVSTVLALNGVGDRVHRRLLG